MKTFTIEKHQSKLVKNNLNGPATLMFFGDVFCKAVGVKLSFCFWKPNNKKRMPFQTCVFNSKLIN